VRIGQIEWPVYQAVTRCFFRRPAVEAVITVIIRVFLRFQYGGPGSDSFLFGVAVKFTL
jgi:hypothetical protein